MGPNRSKSCYLKIQIGYDPEKTTEKKILHFIDKLVREENHKPLPYLEEEGFPDIEEFGLLKAKNNHTCVMRARVNYDGDLTDPGHLCLLLDKMIQTAIYKSPKLMERMGGLEIGETHAVYYRIPKE